MIKAIVFDYTGVISHGPIGDWVRKNLTSEDKRYILFNESSHKWDMGEITLEEIYLRISSITGVKVELIWDKFFENTILKNDVINIIKRLKKKYKIVLFSNHAGELLRRLLIKHKITELFDEILISSEHKMKKPSPEFFNLLLNITKVKKDEMVFVDDNKLNVEATNKFGILCFIFQSSQKLIRDLKSLGVKV